MKFDEFCKETQPDITQWDIFNYKIHNKNTTTSINYWHCTLPQTSYQLFQFYGLCQYKKTLKWKARIQQITCRKITAKDKLTLIVAVRDNIQLKIDPQTIIEHTQLQTSPLTSRIGNLFDIPEHISTPDVACARHFHLFPSPTFTHTQTCTNVPKPYIHACVTTFKLREHLSYKNSLSDVQHEFVKGKSTSLVSVSLMCGIA